jgi:hypothetical protein
MSKKQQNRISFEVIVQEDPETGDAILPIPQELLDQVGWKEGDELDWKETTDGSFVLTKKG